MKNVVFAVVAVAVAAAVGGFLLMGGDDSTPDLTGLPPVAAIESTTVKKENVSKVIADRPQPSESGPWPQAAVDETEFAFGRMTVGAKQDHTFTIRNEGEADLILLAGQPTCKCTVFDLTSTTVKPGETTELLVQWHGKLQDPNFQHGGSVYTNDPERDELRFTVRGIVDASLEVLPNETWSVGDVTDAAPGIFEAVVLSRVHNEFTVSSLECESPFIQTTVTPMPVERLSEYKALCGYVIKLTVSSEMPAGRLEEQLNLKADCADSPISVKVTAYKQGPIRILPTPGVIWVDSEDRLLMGHFSTSQGREVELILLVDESDGAEPLQFTSVDTMPGYISVKLERVGKVGGGKSRYSLKVSIPPGIPRTDHSADNPARIQIETNHPSGQSLQISVTFKAF